MQFLGDDALFTIIDVKSDIVFGYWNLLKVMKNAFCLDLLVMYKNDLIRR